MELEKIRNLSKEEMKLQAAQAGEQLFRIRFQKTLGNAEGLKKLARQVQGVLPVVGLLSRLSAPSGGIGSDLQARCAPHCWIMWCK